MGSVERDALPGLRGGYKVGGRRQRTGQDGWWHPGELEALTTRSSAPSKRKRWPKRRSKAKINKLSAKRQKKIMQAN